MTDEIRLVPLETQIGEVRAVPSADHITVSYCDDFSCPHVHLLLCTPDDRPYTMAVLTAEQLEAITDLAWALREKKK